uniref:Seipin n=1 Tax=Steinernema glaseri TaxID=37863 RepID=A0A1I8AE51_9BILA
MRTLSSRVYSVASKHLPREKPCLRRWTDCAPCSTQLLMTFQNAQRTMKSPLKVAQNSVANLPFWAMVVLTSQIIGILFAATLAPFALRSAVLPSLADYEHPLYFTFTTCFDQLHGVCSYPEAHFHLAESDLHFATDTPYSLSVDFDFTPADPDFPLGVYLVTLQVYDENQTGLASYQRSTVFKDPRKTWSLYRLVRNAFFFPLYMVGYFETPMAGKVHIDFTKSFMDRATRPAASLVVQVQSRYIQIENAKLSVAAHFGLLRYLLYQWPIFSYLVVFTATFAFLACTLLIIRTYYYFSHEEVEGEIEEEKSKKSAEEDSELDEEEEDEEKVVKKRKAFFDDDPIDPFKEGDNPKFPIWDDIPGIEKPKLPPRPLQIVGLRDELFSNRNSLRQRKMKNTTN